MTIPSWPGWAIRSLATLTLLLAGLPVHAGRPADAQDWQDAQGSPRVPQKTQRPSLLAASPPPPTSPAGILSLLAPARIRGRILERGSILAISGARVVVGGASAITDKDGYFFLSLPPGPAEFVITSPGHEPLREKVTVQGGRTFTLEASLSPRHRDPSYGTTVRGDARREGQRFSLTGDTMRQQAGTLGDPFRVVSLLPGVAAPLPIAPFYVIRGASPGANGFFLDGMRVPQLFHLLVGGGVVHSRFVDWLDFYPGAYDASYGRYSGGIIDSGTRGARKDGFHGEAELRIFDVSAALELPLPKDVRITVSGHYGFPGPLVNAIDNRVNVSYWDYQFRLDWRGLTVQALGSSDFVNITLEQLRGGETRRIPYEFGIDFHRIQIRDRERFGPIELEAGIVGGIDEMHAFGGLGVRKLSLNLRANVHGRFSRFRFFVGADTELSRFIPTNFNNNTNGMSPDELGELADQRDGVVAGGFAVLAVDILPQLTATLSGRIDVYHSAPVTLLGLDPRGQLRFKAREWLSFNTGVGLYQQPPSFPVALPGIDTFALKLGLQRAIHWATGVEATLPWSVTLALTGYYQKFLNVNDVVLDVAPQACTSPPPEVLSGGLALITRQIFGNSYGMEVLLRKHAGRFTGWISYTLSRSERVFSCGLRPADFDQTHILNVVGQIRLPWRIMASARFYYATGRPATELELPDWRSTVRNNIRLPDYVQLDLRVDREWLFKKWALSVFLEVVNTTFSTVIFGLQYPELNANSRPGQMLPSTPMSFEPQILGFPWILPSIGIRGRF